VARRVTTRIEEGDVVGVVHGDRPMDARTEAAAQAIVRAAGRRLREQDAKRRRERIARVAEAFPAFRPELVAALVDVSEAVSTLGAKLGDVARVLEEHGKGRR